MRFHHPAHPGSSLRLGYCMNLHAGETLSEVIAGVRAISLPLSRRLGGTEPFGVGVYLPAALAASLAGEGGREMRKRLAREFSEGNLAPFTFNAFPFGDFHRAGLKRQVFEPTWTSDERLAYTLDVALIAAELNAGSEELVTISTHCGRFGPWQAGEFEEAAARFEKLILELAGLAQAGTATVAMALEAEPRSVAGTTRAARDLVAALYEELEHRVGSDLLRRHLGLCLDTCHSAVEFEEPDEAVDLALAAGLSKLQFSSAIRLKQPGSRAAARGQLLGLDEPLYLHQTTGRGAGGLLRVDDLGDLASAAASDPAWLGCEEWRTHFHVPVDLARLGEEGLETTRDHADALLLRLLQQPEAWGRPELQVEIETYTWDILPGVLCGPGALVDGLAREYEHVIALLARAGWTPAA
ncbi:MAG: metabolite traffic protein EboE [bacterium]|nr:hypothetical protein [Planctomycetota bacterium]HIL52601.1 hypothetical protein [Planctomycetota bacterium]